MSEENVQEGAEGAAIFPLIPDELGVHPLLLAVLHAVVFLEASEENVLDPAAGGEALEYLATYLQRLDGPALQRAREDMAALAAYARDQKWPKQQVHFLKNFLDAYGAGA
jgi:hypothetical protein